MKKHLPLILKNYSIIGFFAVFAILLSFDLLAQNTPVYQWDKTFGGNQNDGSSNLKQTTDGGYIMGGYSASGNTGNKTEGNFGTMDFWVVKLDVNGNKTWDKTFGGIDNEAVSALIQTSDGKYIVGGEAESGTSGNKTEPTGGDYWILKLDENGNKIWEKSFGGLGYDGLRALQQTSDGGFILGGYTLSGSGRDKTQDSKGDMDYWIVKLDANANKVWDKTFGGSQRDEFRSLYQTSDGGFILGGTSFSGITGDKTEMNRGDKDYWVIKLDQNGNKTWDKTYGGNLRDELISLQQSLDGGFIIGGISDSGISFDKSMPCMGGLDFWILKLDTNGNKVWDKTYGGGSTDYLSSIKQTFDGAYSLTGSTYSWPSAGGSDFWMLKIDSEGNRLWDKTLGGKNDDYGTSGQQTADGSYIIGGSSKSDISTVKNQNSFGGDDFWVVKLRPTCGDFTAYLSAACSNTGADIYVNVLGLHNNVTGSPAWTLTYSVNGVNQTISGTSPKMLLAQNAVPGTVYSIISITSSLCTTFLYKSFTVQPVPGAPMVTSFNHCQGDIVTLTGNLPAGQRYVWYDNFTGGKILYSGTAWSFPASDSNNTITYYVAVINNAGCIGPRSPVTVTTTAETVKTGGTESICMDEGPIQLKGFSPADGIWSGPGVSNSGVFTPDKNMTGKQTLTYTITRNGCVFTSTKQIYLIKCHSTFIPNIITANNDGKNDTFIPKYLPEGKWHLQIFNQWGFQIFESENYQNNWPESKISEGTYYYLLKNSETGANFKGWVEVVF